MTLEKISTKEMKELKKLNYISKKQLSDEAKKSKYIEYLESNGAKIPLIGMGITLRYHSDRTAGIVVGVVNDNKIHIQIESSYSNQVGKIYTYTRRKNGQWCEMGQPSNTTTLFLGFAEHSIDNTF